MADRFVIINTALAYVKESPIDREDFDTFNSEEDPGDDVTGKVLNIYPQVKAELLNDYPWSWMLMTEQPSRIMVTGSYDPFQYKWQIAGMFSTVREGVVRTCNHNT